MIKKLQKKDITGKTILCRVDYNVPSDEDGTIHDWQSWRIEATLPTLRFLIRNNCKIILLAHSGRPHGKKKEEMSLKPVAKKLGQYLQRELKPITPKEPPQIIQKINKLTQPCYLLSNQRKQGEIRSIPQDLNQGDVLFLENTRYQKGERENSMKLAKTLAQLGDFYISDAFAAAHRKHASLHALAQCLPHAAGKLMQREIKILSQIRDHPKSPLSLVLGGAKVGTKATLIESYLPKLSRVVLGGVVANTVLAAKGISTGKSKTPEEIEQQLKPISITDPKLQLPLDVKTAPNPNVNQAQISIEPVGKIKKDRMILDIGPETIQLYKKSIQEAEEIIWNGNLGLSEVPAFSEGTREIGRAVKESNAHSVVGGGDTVAFLKKEKLTSGIDFCSTGGGAMLEYLAGKKLPGIEILKE